MRLEKLPYKTLLRLLNLVIMCTRTLEKLAIKVPYDGEGHLLSGICDGLGHS